MEVVEPLRHGRAIERLWEATRAGRLPHALSFEGAEGIGRFLAARWFAAGLLCAEGPRAPCGTCGPCKRVASGGEPGNHPDLLVIDPLLDGEERIRVARIAERGDAAGADGGTRSLEAFLDLRALEGGYRPVVIREAHRMNVAAQNALLKTLEEPRPGTLLVLETHRPEMLLPTIKSRVVRLRFERLSHAECAEVLQRAGLDPAVGTALARAAGGSPGRALAFHAREALAARGLLVDAVRGDRAAAAAASALWELDGEFPGKTPSAQARERVRLWLDLLIELSRDRLAFQSGVPAEGLAAGDVVAGLPAAAGLTRVLEALVECRADVERNLGPEAILERALLVAAPRSAILTARSGAARSR